MTSLLTRLQEATGPSFALDCGIAHAILGEAVARDTYPPYTASIDAALTLVPDEWASWWALGRGLVSAYYAHLRRYPDSGAEYQTIEGNGATPALALCIAAIKAREAGRG